MQPNRDRLVLSGKTGQLPFPGSSSSSKPAYCEHFDKEPDSLLVEQILLLLQAKPVQPASPCCQCNLFQLQIKIAKVLPRRLSDFG